MSVPSVVLGQVFVRKLAASVGTTLLYYDYFLTLSLEVAHIWDTPWTPVKVLFLVNRYGNLLGQSFMLLEEMGFLTHGSQRFCKDFLFFCTFFALFSGESIRLLVVMRACAIRRCKRKVTITINTVYVAYGIAALACSEYLLSGAHPIPFEYLEEIGLCFSPVGPKVWALWVVPVILDTVILGVVCYSLYQLKTGSGGFYQTRLIHLLTRDAIVFYLVALINSLLCISCWVIYEMDPLNFTATTLTFPLLSVVGQRVVLNLRRFRVRPPQPRTSRELSREMADGRIAPARPPRRSISPLAARFSSVASSSALAGLAGLTGLDEVGADEVEMEEVNVRDDDGDDDDDCRCGELLRMEASGKESVVVG